MRRGKIRHHFSKKLSLIPPQFTTSNCGHTDFNIRSLKCSLFKFYCIWLSTLVLDVFKISYKNTLVLVIFRNIPGLTANGIQHSFCWKCIWAGGVSEPHRFLRPLDERWLEMKAWFVNSVFDKGPRKHRGNIQKAQCTCLQWIFHRQVASAFFHSAGMCSDYLSTHQEVSNLILCYHCLFFLSPPLPLHHHLFSKELLNLKNISTP